MVVLDHEIHLISETLNKELRQIIKNNYPNLPKEVMNKIFVIEMVDRLQGEDRLITTKRQHIAKKKQLRRLKNEFHESRKLIHKSVERPLVEIKDQSHEISYHDQSTQTDHTDAYNANEEINKIFKTKNSIRENLYKYVETQKKLIKSKKEVMEIVNRQKNKDKYLKIISENGFTLSYAGVLKQALMETVSISDIIKKEEKLPVSTKIESPIFKSDTSITKKNLDKMIAMAKIPKHMSVEDYYDDPDDECDDYMNTYYDSD